MAGNSTTQNGKGHSSTESEQSLENFSDEFSDDGGYDEYESESDELSDQYEGPHDRNWLSDMLDEYAIKRDSALQPSELMSNILGLIQGKATGWLDLVRICRTTLTDVL